MSKYQHDPSIQLGQSFRNKFFPSFRENGADEPQVKRVGCEGKYIGIRSCPILEWQARTSTSTWSFFFVGHTVKTACLIMINKQASINIARKVIEKTVSLSPQNTEPTKASIGRHSGPENLKKCRQKNSWNQINHNFFSLNCIFGGFKLFPSSKIDFWPFLKLQKKWNLVKKFFFREIDLFDCIFHP